MFWYVSSDYGVVCSPQSNVLHNLLCLVVNWFDLLSLVQKGGLFGVPWQLVVVRHHDLTSCYKNIV